MGGLLGAIGVGFGKTLISLLAHDAMEAKRTVLLVPPNLRKQLLEVDVPLYGRHFELPPIFDARTDDPDQDGVHVLAYSQLSSAKHADILEVSRNPETFSSARGGVNIIDQPDHFSEFFGSMIVMDDPRHARLRRIVSRGFTPGMLRKTEAMVDRAAVEIVDGLVDEGTCDFVTDIAAALPLKIICDMMGIPTSEYRYVFDRTNIILGAADPEYVADLAQAVPAMLQAGGELAALMQDLVRIRREKPTDDLTSALVHAEVEGERLNDQEIASFFILLVVAGNETTRHTITHGVLALMDEPAQARTLASAPGQMAVATEEMLRWASPAMYFRRTATREVELGGKRVKAGDKVVVWLISGSNDDDVFHEPRRFDSARAPNPHLAFGKGPHFCFGAPLARLEIRVLELLAEVEHELGEDAGLEKDGVERHLQEALANLPEAVEDGLRLVRREWPTDIGPVDLMCRDRDGEWVAVEIKRIGTIEAVEQLTRYLEVLQRDPALASCRGILAAESVRPQARTLCAARGLGCVEVDLATLRGAREPELTLFEA